MGKIVIEVEDNLDEAGALERVLMVVKLGRFSRNNTTFALETTFNDDTEVVTMESVDSDSFVVRKKK